MQVQEELKKLAEFQKFDLKIQAAQKVLRFIPLDLKNLESDLLVITTKYESLQWQHSDLDKQRLDYVNAIQSDTKLAKELEAKIPSILGRHKEYHFTQKHIDKLKKLCKDRNVEIEKIDSHKIELGVELSKIKENKENLEALLKDKKNALEIVVQTRQQEIVVATKEKEEFKKNISPAFLQKYERISSIYGHGVGIVKNKRCSSCDVLIPEQMFVKLQKGEEILECPHCMRILCQAPLQ
ncbi:MAG: hypothetical protein IPM57_09480 [Oligoflexia bacterium]|nr:hypothetical protein [Oligoflexia bacterium]